MNSPIEAMTGLPSKRPTHRGTRGGRAKKKAPPQKATPAPPAAGSTAHLLRALSALNAPPPAQGGAGVSGIPQQANPGPLGA